MGVLAVDPSSTRTGGSVLGDKTRMARLAVDPAAFVRPSPSAGTLGGVARATSQAMLVLEAAAYDVVLVETVGVGQSEVTVAGMVDTFLFLTLARTGDQLQGIKKGILEIADVIAVNKADGDRAQEARVAARELAGALRLVHGRHARSWTPPVVTCSALTGDGVDEVWQQVLGHRESLGADGLARKRADQRPRLHVGAGPRRAGAAAASLAGCRGDPGRGSSEVLSGELPPTAAADRILDAFDGDAGADAWRRCRASRSGPLACPGCPARPPPMPPAKRTPPTRSSTRRSRPTGPSSSSSGATSTPIPSSPGTSSAPPKRSPSAWSAPASP